MYLPLVIVYDCGTVEMLHTCLRAKRLIDKLHLKNFGD